MTARASPSPTAPLDSTLRELLRHAGPLLTALQRGHVPMAVSNPRLPGNPIIFANGAYCQLTGYALEEIAGRNARFLQGSLTDSATIRTMSEAIAAGRDVEVDVLNYRKDGGSFWNRVFISPIVEAGELLYFASVHADVTLLLAASQTSATLRTTQEHLQWAMSATQIVGTWDWDLADNRIYADERYARLFSVDPRRAAQGAPADDFLQGVHPDDLARVTTEVAHAIATGEPYVSEFRTLCDDQVRWVCSRGRCRLDADGTPLRFPGMTWDITEQKAAEEALRDHRARMDALINQAAVGIVQIGIDGHILMVNRRFCQLMARSEAELLGARLVLMSLPEDIEQSRYRFSRMLDTGEPYFIEKRFVRPDGSTIWVSCHLSLLRDESGHPRCASIIVNDVDARKRAELRQAALFELGDRLRHLREPAEIAAAAAQILCRVCAAARAGYGEIAASRSEVVLDERWAAGDAARVAGTHQLADYPRLFDDLRRGATVAIPDTALDTRTREAAQRLETMGVRALLNVPLMEGDRLNGILYLHHDAPRPWDNDELNFVLNVADRTWAAIKRAAADEALQRLNATLEQRVAERTADRDRMWRLSTDVMLAAGFDLTMLAANPAWRTALDWNENELVGSCLLDIVHPDDRDRTRDEMGRLARGQTGRSFENRCRHRQGSYRWFSWRAAIDEAGIHAVGRDVTAERDSAEALQRAEDQLRQAQKMEAVGQLTGGIAHDFNNILQGVLGPLDLVRRSIELGRTDNLSRFIEIASSSARRAAALTHRLLAFSRRQSLDLKPIDVNGLVTSLEDLLRRTLGERIELKIVPAQGLWSAHTDANQLENSVLNLVINARDAMPAGGRLTVSTANVHVDGRSAAPDENGIAGDYVVLDVTDTGTGMPPEVIQKVFDPFFTTKPIGQGTGLGLSMIYGFAKQSNGHVRLRSEMGVGTSARLYLPRCLDAPGAADAPAQAAAPRGEGRTLLVAEDDAAVRMVVAEVLRNLGYQIIEADDGNDALAAFEAAADRVDLLVTDVGMPGMNGRELADRVRRARPGLGVLFMTGYAENAQVRSGFLEPGMEMIAKPFPLDQLAATIGAMLARSRR